MVYRCILAKWAITKGARRVWEGEFSEERLSELNQQFYNIYYLPNYPSLYVKGTTVDGSQIDTFKYVFVDMDLKEGKYVDKDAFLEVIASFPLTPTRIVDSGNGIHIYWSITDLDAMNFLRLQRRLMRQFNTDEAVGQVYQLMRVPGYMNVKDAENPKMCELLFEGTDSYTCEQLDGALPKLTEDDEAYCKQHFEKTYNLTSENIQVDDKVPLKFMKLLRSNKEVKELWSGDVEDRSKADYRLGHILFGNGFTKAEAMSVLVNTGKARERAPVYRVSYAEGIVEKIWAYEWAEDKSEHEWSSSVKEILERADTNLKGTRFPCYRYLDDTVHGFRLGQVIGLVAGSGVGKTAVALNMFMGFVQSNPDYVHFFIPLEQPANEIADRWKTMCGESTELHEKVHVLSNYDEKGAFRRLSLDEIKDYLLAFAERHQVKIGCVVIDHAGALKKTGKNGENQDIMDICHAMKGFAIETNTLLVMQSQSSREKAGIGDLELNKDAAYGTVYFESYCDYLITMWQPLKRVYSEEGCPKITAFKFCKIRHKKVGVDVVEEDVAYLLRFNPHTERLEELTQEDEKTSFDYFNKKATNLRKQDRKTDLVPYKSTLVLKGKDENGKADHHKNAH